MYDHYGAQVRRQVDELRQQLSAAQRRVDEQQREALKTAAKLRAAETERDRLAKAVQRGDALAKAAQLVANQLATAGLHDHATELCFAIDEFEALDGPAEQSAGPPQLSPASIAAPEPVQPPTLTSMFELAERARAEHDAEQQHLEASIRVTAWVAKLTVRRTEPVEQIAGVPAALARLTATIAELASVTAPTRTAGLVNWLTNAPSLPLVPDESLPAGEVHLRPHPRTAGGPS